MTDTETRRDRADEHEGTASSGAEGDLRAPRWRTRRPACCRARSRPHPTPVQYVIDRGRSSSVITAVEIAVSYIEGDDPRRPHHRAPARMAVVKFFLVASWYMHLRTDQPVFRRFFIIGSIAAIVAVPRRAGDAARVRRAEPGRDAVRRRLPGWTPHPDVWLLVGLLAAGYADRGRAPRPPLVARPDRASVTRFQVTCWSLGVFADLAGVRLADPRHRRAVQLQHPHGAAPDVHRWSRRRCCCSARRPGCCGACCAAALLFRTVRMLARFIPALVVFNLVLVFTHWPLIVNESLRSGCRALLAPRGAVRLVADRVDADREPAARDPAARAGHADALPVRLVGGAHGSGVVPHLRLVAAVQVLRARPAPVRADRRSTTSSSPG